MTRLEFIKVLGQVKPASRKEGLDPFKMVGSMASNAIQGIGQLSIPAALILFGALPISAGTIGGMIGSKITSPSPKDLELMQEEAVAEDITDRTKRLKTLKPRIAPKNLGREGIWRP